MRKKYDIDEFLGREDREFYRRKVESERLRSMIILFVSGFMVIFLSIYFIKPLINKTVFETSTTTTPSTISSTATNIPSIDLELNKIKTDISDLANKLSLLSKSTNEISNLNADTLMTFQIQQIRNDLNTIKGKITQFEDIFLTDPEKAISLVLLKKDFESLKVEYESDLEKNKVEIDRIYNQNNWFIGLLFAMALGLFTTVLSSFLPKRDGDKKNVTKK